MPEVGVVLHDVPQDRPVTACQVCPNKCPELIRNFALVCIRKALKSGDSMPCFRRNCKRLASVNSVSGSNSMIKLNVLNRPGDLSHHANLVLDEMDVAVIICDNETKIVLANPTAQRLYGGDPTGMRFDAG